MKTTSPFTYQISAVEVQAPEKVVCLLSQKTKEVTEDRNSYFHVHIDDYYQHKITADKDTLQALQECDSIIDKLCKQRKGHLLI